MKLLNKHDYYREMLRELNNELKWASFVQLLINVAVTKGDSGERTKDDIRKKTEGLLDLWKG